MWENRDVRGVPGGVEQHPHQHRQWGGLLRLAARVLPSPDRGKQALVAFGLRRGQIVAIGENSYTKTHPQMLRFGDYPFLHAEIACLLKAPKDIDTLFVARRGRKGQWLNAAPCPVCQKAIQTFNPKLKVIYTGEVHEQASAV